VELHLVHAPGGRLGAHVVAVVAVLMVASVPALVPMLMLLRVVVSRGRVVEHVVRRVRVNRRPPREGRGRRVGHEVVLATSAKLFSNAKPTPNYASASFQNLSLARLVLNDTTGT
jgi:hypothetical protein